jgi:hypothetical protein
MREHSAFVSIHVRERSKAVSWQWDTIVNPSTDLIRSDSGEHEEKQRGLGPG